ncbi:putative VQ motif-containing protein/14 [Dioscorea sansibarensis]
MDGPRNPHLGINKLGKNIRKSPLHQPNSISRPPHPHPHLQAAPPPPPPAPPQQPQPQVYNISKNDFRSIVQQLTGTPSRDPLPQPSPRPPPPKPPSQRLQRIRPPPLNPIARPLPPPPPPPPNPAFTRPAGAPWHAGPPAESPVTAYMRYLEQSMLHSDGAHHTPLVPPHHPPFPSPRSNPPPLLPSPGSQLPLPSPSAFLNLLSPRSPYPLLSPGFQYPPPLTPNFSFSPFSQSGILGPGPQQPLSPGLLFPPSPSSFLPLNSPRWRDM